MSEAVGPASEIPRPTLPRGWLEWLRVFGPGAIIASLTIGTGELIFSSRGGAIFGYRILFVFAVVSVLKWGLVVATSRHMLLTGVHPYQRFLELPGPRGWVSILLLLFASVGLPIWLTFHSSVLGNMMSWITGHPDLLNGGIDYIWAIVLLSCVLLLTAVGGYSALERIQMFIIGAMMVCAVVTLLIYNPDWLELLSGLLPQSLAYPSWIPEKYPDIARQSVWVETTRYVGVIGGAGFDYLAYTSWLRNKRWGVLPQRATAEQLRQMAADPQHPIRQWFRAPLIDCAISFLLVIVFSAVFVASGALILGPQELVPTEDHFLDQQSQLFTRLHPWLLPLYFAGAFLTMFGTLYGTVEIACAIADEIVRSFVPDWTTARRRSLKRAVVIWCGSVAFCLLAWLCVRQAAPLSPAAGKQAADSVAVQPVAADQSAATPDVDRNVARKKILLTILTPINLFTGVLSCGLICVLTLWMDARFLPPGLRSPIWLTALNTVSAIIFLTLGVLGYVLNDRPSIAIIGLLASVVLALLIAVLGRFLVPKRELPLR